MAEIPIGLRGEKKLLVTSEVAIDFLGREEARVLSTPHLIWYLEVACLESIKPYLEAGFDSLGTEVNVKHLAAAPLGTTVTFRSEVLSVQNRRVLFKVDAYDESEKIAEGTHERFIVNIERFGARVQVKLRGW